MAYAFVRELTGQANAGAPASVSATVPAAGCAIGNMVVVGVCVGDSVTQPTISDTKGNTWHLCGAAAVNGSARPTHTWMFYSVLTVALVSGNTVTATLSGSPAGAAIVADEFSGTSANTTVDQTAQASGTSTSPSSGSKTTTQANELLIGIIGDKCNTTPPITFSAGSGWTGKTQVAAGTNAISCVLEYQIVSATGSYAATGTLGGGTMNWGALLGTFYESSPPPSNAGGWFLLF